ncbi:MAG: SOS response-associated peptidase [Chloroflexota bacterium]
MCGRFTLTLNSDQLSLAFPWLTIEESLQPRHNIAPGQNIAVVPNNGENKTELYRWGLIPTWAKEIKIGYRMINARAETISEKRSFAIPFRRQRCLILADGFYEWQATDQGKIPHWFHLKTGDPFAFAGIWERWRNPEGGHIHSCSIITTSPNELVAPIHNRMPAMLDEGDLATWIEPGHADLEQLHSLLRPFPAEKMAYVPVSKTVNNPRNDTPQCIAPVF